MRHPGECRPKREIVRSSSSNRAPGCGRGRWVHYFAGLFTGRHHCSGPRGGSGDAEGKRIVSATLSVISPALMPKSLRLIWEGGAEPVRDSTAKWDLIVAWQRGNTPPAARVLIDALAAKRT